MTLFGKIKIGAFLALIVGLGGAGWAWTYTPAANAPNYKLTVAKGEGLIEIATKLEDDHIIFNKQIFLLKSKLRSSAVLQTGEYTLRAPATADDLLDQIYADSQAISDERARQAAIPTAKITFKEGLTVGQTFDLLEEAGVAKKADLIAFAGKPENFSRAAYPFLPDPLTCDYGDLKTCAKYYIEGYLYPDTYNFIKPSTPEAVFARFLNNFDARVWQKVPAGTTANGFYKTLTLASVLEKESGRTKGVTDANRGELQFERANIAQVFINRTNRGMMWGSDVTATYGHGKDICQQTFKVEGCIFLDDPLAQTLYNTYLVKGYPIGPICSPDYDNISAALKPATNDYLYFVADVTGKVVFARDDAGHTENIRIVNEINRKLGL
jgi:UPF0755 protein